MYYITDFCIISFIYLGITTFFYFIQKKVPSARNRLFGALLVLGVISVVMDFIVAKLDPVASAYPRGLIYAANIAFLGTTQVSGPVFLHYTTTLTGHYPRMSRLIRYMTLLPLAVVMFLLLISPISEHGIFTLDDANVYMRSGSYVALQITMGLYIMSSVVLVAISRNHTRLSKRVTIYTFLCFSLAAMLIQFTTKTILVNSMANALALTFIYHVLEAPGQHRDPTTGAYNRAALPLVLGDLFEQGRDFTLLMFNLGSIVLINHTLGRKQGDKLLVRFADCLKKNYPNKYIFCISGSHFAVIDSPMKGKLTAERLIPIKNLINGQMDGESDQISTNITMAAISSSDCGSMKEMMNFVTSVMYGDRRSTAQDGIIVAEKAFVSESNKSKVIEVALAEAIAGNSVQVYYQPIHDRAGAFVALEALCRIIDPVLGSIPPDTFIRMAERNGSIIELGDIVLHKVCRFISTKGPVGWNLQHIGVNLSIVQCAQPGFADRATRIVQSYGIRPSLIHFELTETETIKSMPQVLSCMRELTENGFEFLLDDFGTGYANFDYIAELPFCCIKFDKSLLWGSEEQPRLQAFLTGINDLFHSLELTTVCEGVETAAQVQLLNRIGVDMKQGFYYSKALPEDELLAYKSNLDKRAAL